MLSWRVLMVDQGACFNSTEWNFPDAPLRGRYHNPAVYRAVRGIESFEPWLSRLDGIDERAINGAAAGIPREWHGEPISAVERLLERIDARRSKVRELIWSMHRSTQVFSNWIAPEARVGELPIPPPDPREVFVFEAARPG